MSVSVRGIVAAVFVAAAATGAASVASAATCKFGNQAQFVAGQADVWTSTDCVGEIGGNDSDKSGGNGVVNVNTVGGTGLFGIANWTLDSRWNAGGPAATGGLLSVSAITNYGKVGTWSVSSWSGIASAMLVVKGGNGFTSYLLDLTKGLTGQWSTFALWVGNGQNGPNDPGISHVTLYTTPMPAPVPVPAAGVLMVAGLGALAALRRRRKAA